MKAGTWVFLWATLIGLAAYWHWAVEIYQERVQEVSEFDREYSSKTYGTARSAEKEAEMRQKLHAAYGRRHTAGHALTTTTALLFGLVLCAVGWVALVPARPAQAGWARTRRLVVWASAICAAVAAALGVVFFSAARVGVSDGLLWVSCMNHILLGAIVGALFGGVAALLGGASAHLRRSSPSAAAR